MTKNCGDMLATEKRCRHARILQLNDPSTLHLFVFSEIHEHPLRTIESLAIVAAELAGKKHKRKKFFLTCDTCNATIRRSQLILARQRVCRSCRAKHAKKLRSFT